MPLKLLSSGGGSVLLTANTTVSDFTVNVPAVNGNMVTTADTGSITQAMLGASVYAGYGPAFHATMGGATQNITTATVTKVNFNTIVFDTNSNYSTSNYRFTPTVAGYYYITIAVFASASSSQRHNVSVGKNGSGLLDGYMLGSSDGGGAIVRAAGLIYCNGSTDYIEALYYQGTGSTLTINGSTTLSYFQGHMVRAA